MINNSLKQKGSAHVVIIVILATAVLGVLGYAFWQNFLTPKAPSTTNPPNRNSHSIKNSQKSAVVLSGNKDMNKYINYENGFQFLFPKQIFTFNGCELVNVKYDNYGNTVASEPHYGGSSGPIDVTVLESGDEYIIVPEKTVVLSDPKGTPEAGYIFKSCNVLDTSIDIVDESQKDNFGVKNIALEHRTIKVVVADNKDKVLEVARKIFQDPTGIIAWTSDPMNNRESIDFIHGPSSERYGGGAYKLWYYPAQKRIVYINIGQSLSFQHPDKSDQYYFEQVVDSFKFSIE